jgi:glucose-1-phosphate cytidylyltransferase
VKVVLFCGGKGVRLRTAGSDLPKPMVRVGYRPILWHVMKYYAHFGHKDFILCLGHRADAIKKYFLNYDEALTNDFTISRGQGLRLFNEDIKDWNITFVDTGLNSNIGQRLRAVRHLLQGEEIFLANYSDGLTDLHLPSMVDELTRSTATGAFLCIRPVQSFHIVTLGEEGRVRSIEPITNSEVWINGGYFVFRTAIFDAMKEGEELVQQPFARLIEQQRLLAYRYTGFWQCMDTFKDKQALEAMHAEGRAAWQVWKAPGGQ